MDNADKTALELVPFTTSRGLRVLVVAILSVLTVRRWTRGTVNIFLAPANGTTPPPAIAAGFFQGAQSLGLILIWHAVEGIFFLPSPVTILALPFKWSKARNVRICAILGFLTVGLSRHRKLSLRILQVPGGRRFGVDRQELHRFVRLLPLDAPPCEVARSRAARGTAIRGRTIGYRGNEAESLRSRGNRKGAAEPARWCPDSVLADRTFAR
jgi:hypothetical protein